MSVVNDPVGDMIIRIKNAAAAKKTTVAIPHSMLKLAIAEKLKQHGFITEVEKRGRKVKKTIDITLAYSENGMPRIRGVKRISKPGRRMYAKVRDIVPIKYGHGTSLLSTPRGVMTGEEARKAKLGGEMMFHIW